MKILLLVSLMLSWATLPSLAAANATLSPDEIKAAFGTGKPFTATSASGTKIFSFTFNPDGTALEVQKGNKGISGKWRVSSNGYCTTWGTGVEHCYTVDKGPKGYEVRDPKGTLVANWRP